MNNLDLKFSSFIKNNLKHQKIRKLDKLLFKKIRQELVDNIKYTNDFIDLKTTTLILKEIIYKNISIQYGFFLEKEDKLKYIEKILEIVVNNNQTFEEILYSIRKKFLKNIVISTENQGFKPIRKITDIFNFLINFINNFNNKLNEKNIKSIRNNIFKESIIDKFLKSLLSDSEEIWIILEGKTISFNEIIIFLMLTKKNNKLSNLLKNIKENGKYSDKEMEEIMNIGENLYKNKEKFINLKENSNKDFELTFS